jgi:hypothetical protein
VAQERNGWELDSLPGNPNVSKPDAQQVYEILLKMLDRWNAHDIEGYMEVYLQKFNDGWKIVASHTSIAEM